MIPQREEEESSHQAQQGLFTVPKRVLRLPLIFAPSEESFDSGPSFTMAASPGKVSVPYRVRKADQSIDKFETCNQATILVVWGVGWGWVGQRPILLVGGGIGRPEPCVSGVLEHAAMSVVLVV